MHLNCSRLFPIIALLLLTSLAQSNTSFQWINGLDAGGEDIGHTMGRYGTKGVPSQQNNPGGRESMVTWTDPDGNYWLYGGQTNTGFRKGFLNDLWKYDPGARTWTWMSGSAEPGQPPVQGQPGESSPLYTPGSLESAAAWSDQDGNLWLFGGSISVTTQFGVVETYYESLWKYDVTINQWALIRTTTESVHGSQGIAHPNNNPGGRKGAASWVDSSGNFWLFGGYGYGARNISRTTGYLNDLWKYDPVANMWTWMKGSKLAFDAGFSGVKGTAGTDNTPCSRVGCSYWADTLGNLWVFGGFGWGNDPPFAPPPLKRGDLNDTWKYNLQTGNWTWVAGNHGGSDATQRDRFGVFGDQGQFGPDNNPGSRSNGMSWIDNTGSLWLFGGFGRGEQNGPGHLNDLWKLNPVTGQWAWIGGTKLPFQLGVYGTAGVPSADNIPGGRRHSATWVDAAGNLISFGGRGFNSYTEVSLNDLWRYSTNTGEWTWLDGHNYPLHYGVYGTPLVPSPANYPGTRNLGSSWADNAGNIWLFGGQGYGAVGQTGRLNDLWQYRPATNQWTWVKGAHYPGHPGINGTQGVANFGNTPSGREATAQWTAPDGTLWLFGGLRENGTLGNDLWQYQPHNTAWEWVTGHPTSPIIATYGNIGEPTEATTPGARRAASSWTDLQGNLWLFGGFGRAAGVSEALLNDLWKFDRSSRQWTWVHGANTLQTAGVYGTPGQPAPANTPGARRDGQTWTDAAGTFWLYGGVGVTTSTTFAQLADLWSFDPVTAQWTCRIANKELNSAPVYGTRTVAHATNTPGGRHRASTWIDSDGNLCLFGGSLSDETSVLSDLWTYSPTTNLWTWSKGPSQSNQTGRYSRTGPGDYDDLPGARYGSITVTDPHGTTWLFGGHGLDQRPATPRLQGDLWKITTGQPAAAHSWALYP